jgi:hypothetical protein
MGEGAPPGPAAALAVLGVCVGAEALAVVVCFAALGRFLGLRR